MSPVLERPDDVALVRRTQLDLDLVPRAGLGVEEQHIQAARSRLSTLDLLDVQLTQAQERDIAGDLLLQPLLVEPDLGHFRRLLGSVMG